MKILIVGAGALGSNLTANLVADLRGEGSVTVLDYDSVTERNVQAGTQFYTIEQVGQPKVEALQYNIYKWFEREINCQRVKLTDGTMWQYLSGYDLIIDCMDNNHGRQIVQTFWEEEGLPERSFSLLHVGFSRQFTFAIEWAEGYTVPTDIKSKFDICEMPGASSFVKMVAALASSVVQEFITKKMSISMVGNKLSLTKMAQFKNPRSPKIQRHEPSLAVEYRAYVPTSPSGTIPIRGFRDEIARIRRRR